MPLALLASPKNAALAGLLALCVGASGLAYVRGLRLDAAQARAESAVRDAKALHAGLTECGAINQRNAAALDAQSRAVAELKAESERQEAKARKAADKLLRTAAQARQRDIERRARPDMPTPGEMTAALREAVE